MRETNLPRIRGEAEEFGWVSPLKRRGEPFPELRKSGLGFRKRCLETCSISAMVSVDDLDTTSKEQE